MLTPAETTHLAAALRGDRGHFSQLTEPYRPELQVHCYRMLGSLEDAEDLVQETLLRAWRSLDTYAGRASLRAWLYKIATNACLDVLDKRSRRVLPTFTQAPANPRQPHIPSLDGVFWLEPFPDVLLPGVPSNPEAHYSLQESVRLAFLVALQHLPPRQRAVLLLRDVLDWRAKEVAEQLDMTLSAVNSALHRARTTLRTNFHHDDAMAIGREGQADPPIQQVLDQYIEAWQTADIDRLVALLKVDATFSMPPSPSWYQGREAIFTFLATSRLLGEVPRQWQLVPTRANAQPAFGLYQYESERDAYGASAIQVLTLYEKQIADVTTFVNPALFSRFNLPAELVP